MTYQQHARRRRNRNLQRRQRRESRGLGVTLALALLVAGGGGFAYWHQVIRPASTPDPSTVPYAAVAEREAQPVPVREGNSAISAKPTKTVIERLPVDPRMILADPLRADEHEAAREAIRRAEQAALAASGEPTEPSAAPAADDTIVSEFFGMTIRESDFTDAEAPHRISPAPADADAEAPIRWQTFTHNTP